MARYFFDLHECGSVTRDPEGQELPDIDVARETAIESARAIMCYELSHGHLCLSCHIDINDNEGRNLERVAFRDSVEISGSSAS
ncbi:hypothetical protein H5J25_04200 [Sphingomonas aliaeris]|uniref:DUF6894 domain-containing protein n=1 Tax=Sphingomonas aliaeris TaxID=2759526 RepID=A0A974NW37_9SPHN|nr:hypothetical protein H5J25_04200 [Sphingomonas aliaeris]